MRSLLAAALVAGTLAAPLSELARPSDAAAFTTGTITIDGSFSDWTAVRSDPGNSVGDTVIPEDPDYPGQPDRDVYIVNTTYDDEYLYFCFRRTSGGIKAITFGAYLDIAGDGLLQDGDRVVSWTVSSGGPYASAQSPSPSAWIFLYNQARTKVGNKITVLNPAGDGMGGDGNTPDGWADEQSGQILPAKPMDAYLDPISGVECEARVAWSDIGVAPGTPMNIHFSSGNGNSWGTKYAPSTTYKWIGNPPQYLEENRGQVEDNIGGLMRLTGRAVFIEPNNTGGGPRDTTVVYEHTVTNMGNQPDVYNLTALSSMGWNTQITDAAGNPLASVALAPKASTTVYVRVTIPAGTPDGAKDVAVIRAQSTTDGTIKSEATDTTFAGRIAIFPDDSAFLAPGGTIDYRFTVQNNEPHSETIDLSTISTLGFPSQILDVNGNPISSVDLASGATTTVVVRVTVPAGTPVGSQDVTRLLGTLRSDPTARSSASATTTVRQAITIDPDNEGRGGAGSVVQYTHTITNSWSATETVSLSATSSQGWPVTFWASDGVTPITSVVVGPYGDTEDIIVRVAIPPTATLGQQDVTVVTASAESFTDTATDMTTVRRLATYDSSGYVNLDTDYLLTETSYARATGLDPRSKVYFVWRDPSGVIRRTSPERTVDTQGMAFDSYPFAETDLTGQWTLELRSSAGTLLESTEIRVRWKAEITALSATDAPGVGDDVAVTSTLQNDIGRDIVNSTVTYVIWWDSDGSGTFNAGDIFIDSAGAPHTWDGVSAVSSHVTPGVTVAGHSTWSEASPWTVSNELFPHQGEYNVTATWRELNGNLIDVKTTQFYSIPSLGWPLFLVAFVGAIAVLSRRVSLQPVRIERRDPRDGGVR